MTNAVVVAARRSAIGVAGHAFSGHSVVDLAAPVLTTTAAAVHDLGDPSDVILGNCLGPGGNIARVAALAAGLGEHVPGQSVDRQCGSGLDAVVTAAQRIRAGDADLILAGGAESASTAPWRFWPPTSQSDPVRYTRAPFAPSGFPDPDMGAAADRLARVRGIDRVRQDAYALRSHTLAAEFAGTAAAAAEIVEIGGVSRDGRVRAGMTASRLARLRPAFGSEGTATAGNSCGIADGAAVLAVTTDQRAAGRPGLRILGSAVAAGDPALPGIAPTPAIRQVLTRTGVALANIGAIEITEAFASVALAVIDDLGIDPDTVCGRGGAIALGHPWGASGALLLVRLFTRMITLGEADLGLATCAVGGGLGLAVLVERT